LKRKLPRLSRDEKRLRQFAVLDENTELKIDMASQEHKVHIDRPRARKRYKMADEKARAGIEEAIRQRRLRRIQAMNNWD
jgi:hypothetical protein